MMRFRDTSEKINSPGVTIRTVRAWMYGSHIDMFPIVILRTGVGSYTDKHMRNDKVQKRSKLEHEDHQFISVHRAICLILMAMLEKFRNVR